MTVVESKKKYKLDRDKIIQRVLRHHSDDELDNLGEYYDDLERKFHTDKIHLKQRYDVKTEKGKLTPEIKHELDEYFSDEFYVIENIFLKTFRYSMVVTAYSLLETTLNSLCHYLHRLKKVDLTLDELKGEGIERAKLYLLKICHIDFPFTSHEWNQIVKLNSIRNCIVHAQGDVTLSKSPAKLRNIVANTHGIDINNDRYLIIDKTFIDSAISNIKTTVAQIYDASFKA